MYCTMCGTSLPQTANFCGRCGAKTVELPDRPPLLVAPQPARYASLWRRIGACLIDGVVLWFPTMLVFMGVMLALGAFPGPDTPPPDNPWAIGVAYASMWAVQWLYFALLHSSPWQATPGKQAVGIKVVSLDGERISFGRASLRYLGNLLEIFTFGIGLLVAAYTRRRQTLHDMIGGTLVTNANVTPDEVRQGLEPTPESRLGLLLVLGSPVLFFVLIMAAIAIPAYGDYKLRQQVVADRSLAEPYQAAVEAALARGQSVVEIDNAAIGMPEAVQSAYLSNIEVKSGLVRLWFGDGVDPTLQKLVLTLTPALDEQGGVTWLCGYAAAPEGVTPVEAEYADFTTVPVRLMPVDCR